MGELIFAKRGGPLRGDAQNTVGNYEPFEPREFSDLSWAIKASADQLEAMALKAAVHGGSAESQEAYVTIMLGPLAALDKLRRRITRT